MKLNLNQQRCLKGLLLLALAGNMSWQYGVDALKAVDLASDIVRSEPTVPGPVRRTAPLPTNPNGVTVSRTGIRPPTAAKPQVEVEDDEQQREEEAPSATIKVCGVSLFVEYREATLEKNGKTGLYTLADVTERHSVSSAGKKLMTGFRLSSKGSLDSNLGKAEDADKPHAAREALEESIAGEAKRRLTEIGKCGSTPSVVSSPEKRVRETTRNRPSRRERERDLNDCKRDSDGRLIKDEVEIAECKLRNAADLDTSDDDRATAERKAKRAAEELVSDLKPILKEHLSSTDKEKREDGQRLLEETKETLAALDIDRNTERRMQSHLRDVQQRAGTTLRAKESLEEKLEGGKSLSEEIENGMRDFKDNPNDPMARAILENQMRQLKQMREQFDMALRMNASQGILGQDDVRDYSLEFQNMQMALQTEGSALGGIFGRSSVDLGPLSGTRPGTGFASTYQAGGMASPLAIRSHGIALPRTPPQIFGGPQVNAYSPALPFGQTPGVFASPTTAFRPSPLAGPAFGAPQAFGAPNHYTPPNSIFTPPGGFGTQPTFGAPTLGGRGAGF